MADQLLDAGALTERLLLLGVELRVGAQGGLLVRDREERLSLADFELVKLHAAAIRDDLINLAAPLPDLRAPGVERCDRCAGVRFVDQPIHGGQSTRRDCRRCGRTMGFPLWQGDRDPSFASLESIGPNRQRAA